MDPEASYDLESVGDDRRIVIHASGLEIGDDPAQSGRAVVPRIRHVQDRIGHQCVLLRTSRIRIYLDGAHRHQLGGCRVDRRLRDAHDVLELPEAEVLLEQSVEDAHHGRVREHHGLPVDRIDGEGLRLDVGFDYALVIDEILPPVAAHPELDGPAAILH